MNTGLQPCSVGLAQSWDRLPASPYALALWFRIEEAGDGKRDVAGDEGQGLLNQATRLLPWGDPLARWI